MFVKYKYLLNIIVIKQNILNILNIMTKTCKRISKLNKSNLNKSNLNKSNPVSGGGIFETIGKSLVQVPKQRNYSSPISGLFSKLNPSKLESSSKIDKPQPVVIKYNYRLPNEIDITTNTPNIPINSNYITKEPYVTINSMGKYLLVMYRIINKKPTPKLLLHWLIGFMNYAPTKIFHYIAPNTKIGKLNNFVMKIYKLPEDNNNNKTFIKINNFTKQKAYEEFNTYIKSTNLLPINTYNFIVKGSSEEGINLFNMLSKKHSKF